MPLRTPAGKSTVDDEQDTRDVPSFLEEMTGHVTREFDRGRTMFQIHCLVVDEVTI